MAWQSKVIEGDGAEAERSRGASQGRAYIGAVIGAFTGAYIGAFTGAYIGAVIGAFTGASLEPPQPLTGAAWPLQ
jgi:outer membrane lipoprotein SlyB